MSHTNNIDESKIISDEIHLEAPPRKILNDILPSLISSVNEDDEEDQSPYGPAIIKSEQNINAFIDSRIGGRKENQDSAGFKDTALGAAIVVCDGMGGVNGGRMASSLAVTTILETIDSAPRGADRRGILTKAVRKANEKILAYGAEHPSYAGMGTTVTAIIVSDYSVVAAYVGDSRIYQLRGRNKIFRTFDHSMVFEMVKRKALTEEQARLSAQSNVILKALGVSENVDPDVYELPYQKGDRFILCTDGFWGAMPEEDFIENVAKKDAADRVLADMMKKVDQIGIDTGGKHDNLTAAFVDMKQESKLKEKMNKTAKIMIAALAASLLLSLIFNIIPDKPANSDVTETEAQDNKQIVNETETKVIVAHETIEYYASWQMDYKWKFDSRSYYCPNAYMIAIGGESANLFVKKEDWEVFELVLLESNDGMKRFKQIDADEPYILMVSPDKEVKLTKGTQEVKDMRRIYIAK
jgi:protein phosphatase